MRVNITKDYWDGSLSKTRQVNLDGMSMTQLVFLLMESGVAGITITKVESLEKMLRHTKQDKPE